MEDTVGNDGASATAALKHWILVLNPLRIYYRTSMIVQHYLDKTTPYAFYRWIGTAVLAFLYALRVYYVQGYYLVTYLLGTQILKLLFTFMTANVDRGMKPSDGPVLPIKCSDDFKPLIRRLPEFKLWVGITDALCVAFPMTFYPPFDIPASWPVLLFFWILHLLHEIGDQILHAQRYKYNPFNLATKKVVSKKAGGRPTGKAAPGIEVTLITV